ncbi:hypothetical protein OG730_24310 [Streptomyces sp. NBC_01298]|uniref:hypothetical protein n=1 Tax=Streptomyces sp. NBC_01298 TaxID=2903817 RepID=UPI002E1122FC|nr:hypothetical protein OG730_24310 [Streptomyces sp. NBC_01298]
MPGQRKRARSRIRATQRTADARGRWEPLFSTAEESEVRAYVGRLRADGTVSDPSQLRIDLFCGRLEHPSTYQVSLFVPEDPA